MIEGLAERGGGSKTVLPRRLHGGNVYTSGKGWEVMDSNSQAGTNATTGSAGMMDEEQLHYLEKGEFTCRDFEHLLYGLVENELPLILAERCLVHRKSCQACRKMEEEYREVIVMAQALGAEEPAELAPDIRSRLHKALNAQLGTKLPEDEE